MQRFKVSDLAGSDLLRTRASAREVVAKAMGRDDGWYWRKFSGTDKPEWVGPVTRGAVLSAFDNWGLKLSSFAVARKSLLGMRPKFAVRYCDIPVVEHPDTQPATDAVDSLLAFAFPDSLFAGSYVYKEDSWGWSDHAWGTATDRTQHGSATCATMFDWLCRMAQSGNMDYAYALGNRSGRVFNCSRQANGSYAISAGGGDDSHLWHTHVSQVNHHGAKPPRAGGVW